jgi:hypothetical protein
VVPSSSVTSLPFPPVTGACVGEGFKELVNCDVVEVVEVAEVAEVAEVREVVEVREVAEVREVRKVVEVGSATDVASLLLGRACVFLSDSCFRATGTAITTTRSTKDTKRITHLLTILDLVLALWF